MENVRTVFSKISCLILVDNSEPNSAPIIISSFYEGQLCFQEITHEREITWTSNVLPEKIEVFTQEDFIVQLHKQFCNKIQESTSTYGKALEMGYFEKSALLTKA